MDILQYFGGALAIIFGILVICTIITTEYETLTGKQVKKWIADAIAFSIIGFYILLFVFVCILIYYAI